MENTTPKNPSGENNINPAKAILNNEGTPNKESVNLNPHIPNEDEVRLSAFIETKNRDFFGKMTSGGKEIFKRAYEGIYMTPGINKLVGKMEIAYNQFRIDKIEDKASAHKDKLDALSLKNKNLYSSIFEIEDAAKNLDELGIGGSASLLNEYKKIEGSIYKNEDKSDVLQGKIENRENRVKLFANKRDAIADRLITHYEKKLSPVEGKQGVLEDRRNEVELFCVAQEVKLEEQRAKIKKLEEAKARIEKAYMTAGFSDKKIKRNSVVKELEDQINSGYSFVQIEQAKNSIRRREINEKIAKVNRKAEPYRNRKNQFIRVKNNRPIDFKLEERNYGNEFKSGEGTESHTRGSGGYGYSYESNTEPLENDSIYGSTFEGMENLSDLMSNYNEMITEKGDKDLIVSEVEFLKATRLSGRNKMNIKNFIRIIEQYYKAKKINKNKYEDIISKFK